MADGLNQARAMRVAEIMGDFRNVQNYLSSIRANPSAEEYNQEGYVLLRRCVAEAQALLQQPFHTRTISRPNSEEDKTQLRRIIVDASVRRFRVQRIYFRTVAALRWINARTSVLHGQAPQAHHTPQLQQINQTLRTELANITNAKVEHYLRQADEAEGKWVQEDPTFELLLRLVGS